MESTVSWELEISEPTMDFWWDIKIFLILTGFWMMCCATDGRSQNAGYNYNQRQKPSGLNNILKAVLVHESTGHGLYSGSISNAKAEFKVTKQEGQTSTSDYSYAVNQASNSGGLKVFHRSKGLTGNVERPSPPAIAPQVQIVKIIREDSEPQAQPTGSFSGYSYSGGQSLTPGPSPSLRYIHEKALSRPEFNSGVRKPIVFPTNVGGTSGANVKSNKFYGAARESGSNTHTNQGFQYSNQDVTSSSQAFSGVGESKPVYSLYPYSNPAQPLNSGFGNENFRSTESRSPGTTGYQYSSQAPSGGLSKAKFENLEAKRLESTYSGPAQTQQDSAPNNYQYSSPVLNLFNGYTNDIARNPLNEQSQGGSSGYQYQSPQNVDSNFRGALGNAGFQNADINRPSKTFLYSGPVKALSIDIRSQDHGNTNEGYRYEKPIEKDYQKNSNEAEQIAISQYAIATQQLNGATQGYRYDNPSQSSPILKYSKPGPVEVDVFTPNFGKIVPSANVEPRYEGPALNLDERHATQAEEISALQNDRPSSAKSVFKGQSYLPLPTTSTGSGYRYEAALPAANDEQYGRPHSSFKGQPYLPIPSVDNDKSNDGYRYEKPDESDRPATTFKGQSYLPLPPGFKDAASENDSSRLAQNEDDKYLKPQQPRPSSYFRQPSLEYRKPAPDPSYSRNSGYHYDRPEKSFESQPNLSSPPASGGW